MNERFQVYQSFVNGLYIIHNIFDIKTHFFLSYFGFNIFYLYTLYIEQHIKHTMIYSKQAILIYGVGTIKVYVLLKRMRSAQAV